MSLESKIRTEISINIFDKTAPDNLIEFVLGELVSDIFILPMPCELECADIILQQLKTEIKK